MQAVIFNVVLDDPVSRMLGIENHVCEIQLVPAAFQVACLQVSHSLVSSLIATIHRRKLTVTVT